MLWSAKQFCFSCERYVLKSIYMKLAVAAGLVSLCAASNAQLFDNGGPNQQIGYAIVPDKSADGFNLGANSTISSVEFWDLQQSTAVLDGNISWTIYSNVYDSNSAMNLPGSALAFGDTTYVQ